MDEDRIERIRKPGRTFTFSLGFGRRPPEDNRGENEIRAEGQRDPQSSAEDRTESRDQRLFSLEFEDGQLRVGGQPVNTPLDKPAQSEPLPDLTKLGRMYEDTATVHRWLNRIILAIAIAIPAGLIVAGVVSRGAL